MADTTARRAYVVHRARIGDYVPSTIKTAAAGLIRGRNVVAIGREDGQIEIRYPDNHWHDALRIAGKEEMNLKCLVWGLPYEDAQGLKSQRLFGASLSGFVFEVDLESLTFKHVRDSYGGAVWSMTASPKRSTIAIGCEDGAVRLYSYEDDSLEYQKTLPTIGCRVLSLAWYAAKSHLLAGGADGTIRCFDDNTGRPLYRMTGEVLRGLQTFIWSLDVLEDYTVVSGDNRGNLQLWDGHTGTLKATHNQHTADVLAITHSRDQRRIFASGVDSKVVCLQRLPREDEKLTSADDWVYTSAQRPHSHDVYALAAVPTDAGHELLVSGGLDTKVCAYQVDGFSRARPVWILSIPPKGLISSATRDGQRLLLFRHRRQLDLWGLSCAERSELDEALMREGQVLDGDLSSNLLLRISCASPDHLVCSTMSIDGQLIACADGNRTVVYSRSNDNTSVLRRVVVDSSLIEGALSLNFTPDGSRLVATTTDCRVVVLDVSGCSQGDAPELVHRFDHRAVLSRSSGSTSGPLTFTAINADGQWLAVGDVFGQIGIYDLDTLRHVWTLPVWGPILTSLQFHVSDPTVILTFADNGFAGYDVDARSVCGWSSNLKGSPKELVDLPQPVLGTTTEPGHSNTLLLWGQGFTCFNDVNAPATQHARVIRATDGTAREVERKRQRKTATEETTEGEGSMVINHRYRSLIHVELVAEKELLVVENPWIKILNTLPGTLDRPRYGT